MTSEDENPDIEFRDDPTEPIPEGAARFELFYPNASKYPEAKGVMVKIHYEDMEIMAVFPADRGRRFQDLLRCFDKVIPKLIEARDREVQIRLEAESLDAELDDLLNGTSE